MLGIDGEAENRVDAVVAEIYPSEPPSPLDSSANAAATTPCPPNQDTPHPQKVFWNPSTSSNLCGGGLE